MRVELGSPVHYWLRVGNQEIYLNDYLGQNITLHFTGEICCIHCGRKTSKSFSQGYCFPCFKTLAQCDMCIVRPQTCHFSAGTCRDETWALGHCMQKHFVYLSNSSGIKVGITRADQIPTRWIDQGAYQAVKLFSVANRYHSGLLEVAIKEYCTDRTDWRKMLKQVPEEADMDSIRQAYTEKLAEDLQTLKARHVDLNWSPDSDPAICIEYPVAQYPEKIISLSFDKTPSLGGALFGIKGQYLIFDQGVINIRKFAGYNVDIAG